jgi:hypothetical protein
MTAGRMLAATKYGAWMTLRELSKLTGYGEASIAGVNWSEEVRWRVRKELLRREMFPPRQYFISEA